MVEHVSRELILKTLAEIARQKKLEIVPVPLNGVIDHDGSRNDLRKISFTYEPDEQRIWNPEDEGREIEMAQKIACIHCTLLEYAGSEPRLDWRHRSATHYGQYEYSFLHRLPELLLRVIKNTTDTLLNAAPDSPEFMEFSQRVDKNLDSAKARAEGRNVMQVDFRAGRGR